MSRARAHARARVLSPPISISLHGRGSVSMLRSYRGRDTWIIGGERGETFEGIDRMDHRMVPEGGTRLGNRGETRHPAVSWHLEEVGEGKRDGSKHGGFPAGTRGGLPTHRDRDQRFRNPWILLYPAESVLDPWDLSRTLPKGSVALASDPPRGNVGVASARWRGC